MIPWKNHGKINGKQKEKKNKIKYLLKANLAALNGSFDINTGVFPEADLDFLAWVYC
jgi:hypothetical protein